MVNNIKKISLMMIMIIATTILSGCSGGGKIEFITISHLPAIGQDI